MYQIVEKTLLASQIYSLKVYAPRVAKSAKPGQFIIVKMHEKGERVPLTICDYDEHEGTVTIVFQTLGSSTKEMAKYEVGDCFTDFVGPLGQPSEMVHMDQELLKSKNILFVAGGVGAAPVYPQVKWLHEKGSGADVIVGCRSTEQLILKNELEAIAKSLYVTTDDGSSGHKGLVTDVIKQLVNEEGKHYDLVVAIGPMIMMKFVAILTKELGIHTIVSMNPIMIDGTGMCGACRVSVGGETKFACMDGPEFDGHLVDFDEAMRRQTMYRSEEAKAEFRHQEHEGGCCVHSA